MSQKSSRKTQSTTAISEEKEKQQSNSPLKDIKKKVAANAEKEKQAADKTDKPVEKNDKPVEKMDKPSKPVEKMDKQSKPAEKLDKSADKADKSIEKSDKSTEKATKTVDKTDKHEKTEKAADKKQEKTDKNDKKADKPVEKAELTDKKEGVQGDKNAKDKAVKPVNGTHNGSQPTNGADGTVSDSSEDDLVIEEDDVYPELTYDESDTDAFETDASRSLTRRSQVKVTKTPETPRPASEKDPDDSKEPKILKLTETPASDRKLRSADSPKPDAKKIEPQKKPQESKTNDASKGGQDEKNDSTKKEVEEKKDQKVEATSSKDDKSKHFEIDVVIELDSNEDDRRGKCRARVSPYSRPKLDLTTASLQANYTGNNTTMEMDITETSIEENPDDSGYLRGLRTIRGRTSYKKLAELPPITRTARPNLHNSSAPITLPESRPLGTVVGRKRKPSPEHDIEVGTEARDELFATRGKRVKLFDRITLPFMSRRAAEIVGINTDLPLTAPVASTSFDPETIKPTTPFTPQDPIITPITTQDRDGKRCIIM